jgi:anti-sigma factor RsiW
VSDDHSSFDELADLDEGLLAPSRADEVRAHLAGCADCRARHQALRDVHDELAVLPPETMPPAVAERLDRALADAAVPRSSTIVPFAPVQRRRQRGPALSGIAAAVVVVGLFVAIGVGALGHGGGTSSGGAAESSGSTSLARTEPSTAGHFTTTVSPRTFTHTSIPAQVRQLVAGGITPLSQSASGSPVTPGSGSGSGSDSGSGSGGGGSNSPELSGTAAHVPKPLLPLYNSPTKLVTCAAEVAPTKGSLPEAVVFGRYTNAAHKRTPSVFFVFADGATRGDIVVVGPTCAGLEQSLDFFHGVLLR